MASDYPGALDSFSNPTGSTAMNDGTTPHAAQHADANDAIEAIQATLGIDPQGGEATVVARLDAIEASASAFVYIAGATFTTASAVNVNSVFSSTYSDYVVRVTITAASATTDVPLRWRLRASGTDNSSSVYDYAQLRQGSSGSSNDSAQNQSYATIGHIQATAYGPFSAEVTFILPASASYNTTGTSRGVSSGYGFADMSTFTGGFLHSSAAAFDGFTFYPDSGTITGKYRVYGLADS